MYKFINLVFAACFSLLSTVTFGQSWSMKTANLMTPFASTIDTTNVLGEYPRPQMVRESWMNLNGIWQFQPGTSVSEPIPAGNLSSKILVPFPVESAISGVMTHYDKLWYRRTFTVPEKWSGQRILLHFGAVDWESEVFVNGISVGVHKGGYDPFTFDITSYLTGSGSQELTVRVFDPTSAGGQPRGKQSINPTWIMYTCSSGIWQTVWMEPVPQTSISDIKIVPDIDRSVLNLKVATKGAAINQTVTVTVKDGENVVTTFEGTANANMVISVPDAKLWSPDFPFLYNLSVTLKSAGQGIDSLSSYFGMRKISMAKVDGFQKMMLNNDFLFQIGPLDQGFWPDGLYTAPTDAALKFDIEKAKELGFNMIRKHIKVEPARWYYWADKLGLMVWQDMPAANAYTEVTTVVDKVAFHTELIKLVETHWNSPSIVMWVIFNEGCGQHDTKTLVNEVMALDTTRLVNQASGGSSEGVGHVLDVHEYPAPGCASSKTQTLACGEYGGLWYSVANHIWKPGFGNAKVSGAVEAAAMYNTFTEDLRQFKTYNGLSAAVYTQITDVEIEHNGLVTYDRVVTKADAEKIFTSNQKAIHSNIHITEILPTAATEPQSWNYTFVKPANAWYLNTFNDSQWSVGLSGFGTASTAGAVVNTPWNTNDIWLRKKFYIYDTPLINMDSIYLSVHHDEDCEIYINGKFTIALTGYTSKYLITIIPAYIKQFLLPNAWNSIAIHCNQTAGGQYIDAGLNLRTVEPVPMGINLLNKKECSIYPNPVVDKINLTGFESLANFIQIYNALGELVFQKNHNNQTIDVSMLSKGFYLLRIQNSNKSRNFKFFKEN